MFPHFRATKKRNVAVQCTAKSRWQHFFVSPSIFAANVDAHGSVFPNNQQHACRPSVSNCLFSCPKMAQCTQSLRMHGLVARRNNYEIFSRHGVIRNAVLSLLEDQISVRDQSRPKRNSFLFHVLPPRTYYGLHMNTRYRIHVHYNTFQFHKELNSFK